MIICLCHGINDRQVRDVMQSGAKTLGEISKACRAGSDCGTCCTTIRSIMQEPRDDEREPQQSQP